MKNFILYSLFFILFLCACTKQDPILPGTRENIFGDSAPAHTNQTVPDLTESVNITKTECPYTQDSTNTVWDGAKKVFSGFPTSNYVHADKIPQCDAGFVYAGLSTGELVKINRRTRAIEWIADIYRGSNMTGGAAILDITAPIVLDGANIYAAGLGDAFCKLNKSNGNKIWCANIGVGVGFIVLKNVSFVLSTDNTLYAINNQNGAIYWAAPTKRQSAPKYNDGTITVGRQDFDAHTGIEK